MLDRLPVELLQHILSLAAPLEYTPDKYEERRELLRNCCMLARRMKEVAQPMLPEVFVVHSDSALQQLKQNVWGGKSSSAIKLLSVEGFDQEAEPGMEYPALFRLTPAVVDLRVSQTGEFDFHWLKDMTNLQRVAFSEFSPPVFLHQYLPRLVELTIFCEEFDNYAAVSFTSSNLPSLRALSISDAEGVLPSLPCDLFAQLEVFNTDLSKQVLMNLSALAAKGVDTGTVLLDMDLEKFCRHFPALFDLTTSCRLIVSEDEQELLASKSTTGANLKVERSVLAAADKIRTSSQRLRLSVLVLPLNLRPSHIQHSGTRLASEGFLAACEAKGVEVIWEEQPDWSNEHWTSPAFWERSRRAKIESKSAGAAG